MPSRFFNPVSNALQIHTVVDQPLTDMSHGHISCRPLGMEPIQFEWTGPNGQPVQVDASGSEAYGVVPGRYRIVARDANNLTATVTLDVASLFPSALVISDYSVVPASTDCARDGTVEAIGVGLDHGWKFLWTNGVKTDGPVLHDVPSGTYAMLALPQEGKVPTIVHQCPPAYVGVRSRPM